MTPEIIKPRGTQIALMVLATLVAFDCALTWTNGNGMQTNQQTIIVQRQKEYERMTGMQTTLLSEVQMNRQVLENSCLKPVK